MVSVLEVKVQPVGRIVFDPLDQRRKVSVSSSFDRNERHRVVGLVDLLFYDYIHKPFSSTA